MDRRVLAGAAVLLALAMSAGAAPQAPAPAQQPQPQKRGPVLPVVRPPAKDYPLRAKTEIKGDVDSRAVVDAAWSGPRLAQDQGDAPRQWMRAPQTAWEKLLEWRDATFADARGEQAGRR